MKLFCISGVQRSGMHFFIDYVIHMFPNVLFKNDCGLNPTTGHYPYVHYENGINKKQLSNNIHNISLENIDCIILGSENHYIDDVKKIKESLSFITTDITIIQVIRNPKNVLASCIKFSERAKSFTPELIESIYKTLLKIINNPVDGVYYVHYDNFLMNENLRKQFVLDCKSIKNYEFVEKSRKKVKMSSFSGNNNFLERYKQYENHPIYKKLTI